MGGFGATAGGAQSAAARASVRSDAQRWRGRVCAALLGAFGGPWGRVRLALPRNERAALGKEREACAETLGAEQAGLLQSIPPTLTEGTPLVAAPPFQLLSCWPVARTLTMLMVFE